jgi:thiamine-phosphate pyrophosphorylase
MPSASTNTTARVGRLHVLTDYHFQQRFSHSELARRAIRGGADVIQFREKHAPVRHRLREAKRTAALCREASATLIINDDLDVMLASGATGVHLGQTDFPVAEARRVLGPTALIGATATTPEQARQVELDGADYIGFGPVFATDSKANPALVKGVEGLRRACEAVALPVIAIAGLTPERVQPAMEAGAHGVAVMSAVTLADDPEAAARSFSEQIEEAKED